MPCNSRIISCPVRVLPLYDSGALKDKFRVDKTVVKEQPYKLLNTSREFFPSFHALNFHKFDD